MAINFPDSPSLNTVFTDNGISWKWNGTTWEGISSSTIITALNDIEDVNVGTTITDGHVLKWDLSSTKWVAAPDLTSSGGSGGIALTDISVIKPNPAASGSGDVTYNSTSGAFSYTPPVIPTNVSSFTNDAGYLTSAVALTDISVVKPNPSASGGGDVTYDNSNGQFTYTPPSIPAAQVQSDWNASSGLGEILNKPTLFSGSYADLTNKPTIPSNLSDLANVSNTAPNNNEVLKWNGSVWAPAADAGGSASSADPIGTITIWSGTVSNIPTGYQLCDGSASATTELQAIRANVPDLRDRFVVGSGSTYSENDTGGSADSTLPSHTHSLGGNTNSALGNHSHNISGSGNTNNTGNHTHTGQRPVPLHVPSGDTDRGDSSSDFSVDSAVTQTTNSNGSHSHNVSISGNTSNSNLSHSHTISGNIGSAGSSSTGTNLPPYYALCYIIKNAATATQGGGSGENNVQADWNVTDSNSDQYIQNKPTLFSGSYTDLTNKPTLFSGSYTDLSNKPTVFSGAYADLTGKPTLFSGSYADLTNKPTIAATLDNLSDVNLGTVSEGKILKYTNGSWSAEDESSGGGSPYSIAVTASGSSAYTLSGTDKNGSVSGNNPTIYVNDGDIINFSVNASGHPFLVKTVNSTGTGNQLATFVNGVDYTGGGVSGNGTAGGTVTLYTASLGGTTLYYNCQYHSSMAGSIVITGGSGGENNVQADWNESSTSSDAYIQNKPTLFSGNYNDLTNQPTIPGAQSQVDWAQSNSTAIDFIKNKPTNVSSFINDAGYITSASTPSSVPAGTIVMYNGSSAPSGWVICDGNNSTPDLRDKFILAAGSTYSVGDTGGSADAVVVSHSHGAGSYGTNDAGSHTHGQGNMSTNNAGGHSHDAGNFNTNTVSSHSHTQSGSGSGTTGTQSHNHYHTTSQNITIGGGSHVHGVTGTVGTGSGLDQGNDYTGDYSPRSTDAASHTHNFNFTVDTLGVSQNHTHDFNFTIGGNTGTDGAHSHSLNGNTGNTSAHSHNVSGSTSSGGEHSHTVTGNSASEGISGTGKNLPPYYTLTFIMKT